MFEKDEIFYILNGLPAAFQIADGNPAIGRRSGIRVVVFLAGMGWNFPVTPVQRIHFVGRPRFRPEIRCFSLVQICQWKLLVALPSSHFQQVRCKIVFKARLESERRFKRVFLYQTHFIRLHRANQRWICPVAAIQVKHPFALFQVGVRIAKIPAHGHQVIVHDTKLAFRQFWLQRFHADMLAAASFRVNG